MSTRGTRAVAPPGFSEFVIGRSGDLYRIAYLLVRETHAAEDLVQASLVKAWRAWGRIEGEPWSYVRKILLREFLDTRDRRWKGERPTEVLPESPVHDRLAEGPRDPAVLVSESTDLAEAVGRLPPRQRAVVVLRYFHDLTELQTAEVLEIAVGTVKSQHAKAMAALRGSEALGPGRSTDQEGEAAPAPERRAARWTS